MGMSRNIGKMIGDVLGGCVEVDIAEGNEEGWGAYLRIKARIYVRKILRRLLKINLGSYGVHTVRLQYERLLIFCFVYGIIGHKVKDCPIVLAKKEKGKGVTEQYGQWMKASPRVYRANTQRLLSSWYEESRDSSESESKTPKSIPMPEGSKIAFDGARVQEDGGTVEAVVSDKSTTSNMGLDSSIEVELDEVVRGGSLNMVGSMVKLNEASLETTPLHVEDFCEGQHFLAFIMSQVPSTYKMNNNPPSVIEGPQMEGGTIDKIKSKA